MWVGASTPLQLPSHRVSTVSPLLPPPAMSAPHRSDFVQALAPVATAGPSPVARSHAGPVDGVARRT